MPPSPFVVTAALAHLRVPNPPNAPASTKVLRKLREETATLQGFQMQISPEQGQFMGLVVELLGVRRAVEVGVYTGYSSLAVAMVSWLDG